MRALLFAAAVAVSSVADAFAGDVMASRYGNTTIATDAAGIQTKIYYKADGTLSGKQGELNFKGTWTVGADRKLCITFGDQVPNGMTNPFCVPVAAHKIGDTWKARDLDVRLVKGIR